MPAMHADESQTRGGLRGAFCAFALPLFFSFFFIFPADAERETTEGVVQDISIRLFLSLRERTIPFHCWPDNLLPRGVFHAFV